MQANGGAGALLRRGVGAAGLVMMLAGGAGCPGPSQGDCSSTDCPDGQYCDVTERICISAGGPVVQIQTPTSEQAITGQSVVLSGIVLPAAQANQVTYQVGQSAPVSLLVSEQGSFSTAVPLPTGSQTVTLTVQASSDAQAYTGSVVVQVAN